VVAPKGNKNAFSMGPLQDLGSEKPDLLKMPIDNFGLYLRR
jgi:hypothetical protein